LVEVNNIILAIPETLPVSQGFGSTDEAGFSLLELEDTDYNFTLAADEGLTNLFMD